VKRAPEPTSPWRSPVQWALAILLALVAIPYFVQQHREIRAIEAGTFVEKTDAPKRPLAVKIGENRDGMLYGTAVNQSGRDLSYVQITFRLADDAGDQVGTTMTNTTHLKAGATWKWSAMVLEERATKVQVADVTALP
jgi:hypothetical protein